MNFSVYNTSNTSNFPESGIFSTYVENALGRTRTTINSPTLAVDNENIYYPSPHLSYISKNIHTIAILNTSGDIISLVEPNLPASNTIIGEDENYVYAAYNSLRVKNNASINGTILRINKSNFKIDNNFCIGGWRGYSPSNIQKNDNKYYILSNSSSTNIDNQIYPNLDENSSAGVFLLKNKQNISNFGSISNASFNKVKFKDNDIYVAGRTAHVNSTSDLSKIFKINKNLQIDNNFYPYIERLNNTSVALPGGLSSDVFDFDFDNEGIYIGGNFLAVNGERRIGVAKIDYSGNLISGFNANINYGNNSNIVRAILTTGSGVFVAGSVTGIGGSGFTQRVFRLNNDGSLNTNFSGRANGNIATAMAISGNHLYVGTNNMTSFSGVTFGLARMNAENGILPSSSEFSVSVGTNSSINKILVTGDSLYICSDFFNGYENFNNALSHSATGVIKVRASDGNPDTGFRINFNVHSTTPTVQDMFIKGNELHIVGNFTGIEGRAINSYAIVDTVSGKLLDNKNYFITQNTNRAIAYNQNNDLIAICGSNNLYTTGYNFDYNSKINVFDNNFNILTGIQFNGGSRDTSAGLAANQSFITKNLFYIDGTTGYLSSGNGPNYSVRAFNITNGNMIDSNTFMVTGNGFFNSIVKYNNQIYIGGTFTSIAGKGFTGQRTGLFRINNDGSIDTSFNLLTSPGVVNLKVIDNNLYMFNHPSFGSFSLTGVSGVRVENLVKYNSITNTFDTGFNDFLRNQPTVINIHNDSQNNLYFVLNPNNSNEYTGSRGYFENSGHLFKFNSGSYTPNFDFTSKYFWLAGDITISDDKIFAPLRSYNKISGSSIYKINKKTRQISNDRVNIISSGINQGVIDMYATENSIYVAGNFTGVNNIAKTGVCKLNKSDLSLDTNFDLNIGNGSTSYVLKIFEKDNYLYFAGNYLTVNNQPFTGLCRINKSNDILDTNYKINLSGLNLDNADGSIDIVSGNLLYHISTTFPRFRIIDLDQQKMLFTGNPTAAPSNANLVGLSNANGNLFLCGSANFTLSNASLIGERGRGAFVAGYNSGELIPPYSVWTSTPSMTIAYPKYISANNTVFAGSNLAIRYNNTSDKGIQSYVFFDANKLFIKNKRNPTYTVGLPDFNYTRAFERGKNEVYILYANYLLPNPENNLNMLITNNGYSRGIIKYDPIKERYDIII